MVTGVVREPVGQNLMQLNPSNYGGGLLSSCHLGCDLQCHGITHTQSIPFERHVQNMSKGHENPSENMIGQSFEHVSTSSAFLHLPSTPYSLNLCLLPSLAVLRGPVSNQPLKVPSGEGPHVS